MKDTKTSRQVRSSSVTEHNINKEVEEGYIWFLKRVNRRCPAIKFAVRRIDRVNGRIRDLKISIITMKGIRAEGVPVGIRWAIIF
jgi:hypothetical protein